MALIKCPECNSDISNTALKCPKCGFALKKKNKTLIIIMSFFMIIITLLIVLLIGFVLFKKHNNDQINQSRNKQAVTNTIVTKTSYEDLVGAFNIDFGNSYSTAKLFLETKGWKLISKEGNSYKFENYGTIYEGHQIKGIYINFFNDKLYRIDIYYDRNKISFSMFSEIMNRLDKKYGLTLQYEEDDYLQYETDNNNYICFGENRSTYTVSLIDSKLNHEKEMDKLIKDFNSKR